MRRVALALIMWGLPSLAHVALAQRPLADPESMIERLVAKPVTDNANRRYGEPRAVNEAIKELRSLGVAAFPALIAHRDDQRHSYSIEGEGLANYPRGVHVKTDRMVGQVCVEIIANQLNAGGEYQGCANFVPDSVSKKTLPQWWKAHSSKSLSELRIETLKWTIAEETRRSKQDDVAKRRVAELVAELEALDSRKQHPANSRRPRSSPSANQPNG
jgi:hypothetical protein